MIDYCYRGKRAGEFGDISVALVWCPLRPDDCNRVIAEVQIPYPVGDLGPFDWGSNSNRCRRSAKAIVQHLLGGSDVQVGDMHQARIAVELMHDTISRLPFESFELWASDIVRWLIEKELDCGDQAVNPVAG
jgi:hypothetical protein